MKLNTYIPRIITSVKEDDGVKILMVKTVYPAGFPKDNINWTSWTKIINQFTAREDVLSFIEKSVLYIRQNIQGMSGACSVTDNETFKLISSLKTREKLLKKVKLDTRYGIMCTNHGCDESLTNDADNHIYLRYAMNNKYIIIKAHYGVGKNRRIRTVSVKVSDNRSETVQRLFLSVSTIRLHEDLTDAPIFLSHGIKRDYDLSCLQGGLIDYYERDESVKETEFELEIVDPYSEWNSKYPE